MKHHIQECSLLQESSRTVVSRSLGLQPYTVQPAWQACLAHAQSMLRWPWFGVLAFGSAAVVVLLILIPILLLMPGSDAVLFLLILLLLLFAAYVCC